MSSGDGTPGVRTAGDHWQANGQLTEANARSSPDDIEVVPFVPERHLEMVTSWAHQRQINVPLRLLPKGGRIVEDVAVGFMYVTDSPVAIMDPIWSNLMAPADRRDIALDRLIGSLFDMVRSEGYDTVWAWTALPEVVERCRRLGFKEGARPQTFGSRRI